ncbi:hypothetical protein [Methanoregula sp.]|uniref:hypothetical protein n=1 Tax=Methanoregula sp. TaxID=2052170 RepID=UPI00262BF06F|nr:hypothetical protein [Methanoregula sp.]MDD5144008.1 hypothetical protein [Methanoregula sp.]
MIIASPLVTVSVYGQRGIREGIVYAMIAAATYFFFQSVIVVIHEHIHSTTASLLGRMQDPLAIVWGNPLTLDGWDEGVSYSDLFNAGLGADAAVIAVMPLVFHAVVVTAGMYILLSPALENNKWSFHLVFWFIIVNLMELIAYMPLRAFAGNGDIGNINHGLGLSPWVLFFWGTILIFLLLGILFFRILPRANVIIAGDSRPVRYVLLFLAAFFVFDWRSIFCVILLPPASAGWETGSIALIACVLVILLCRPGLTWIRRAEEHVQEKTGG